MRKLTALTAALFLAASVLVAQTVLPFTRGVASPGLATAANTDIAFLIKHVGTSVSGTMAVVSGDVLLKVGAYGSEAADTTITGCGGTAGTLDVDNAACNSLGELLGRINVSANWRAVPVDGLFADVTSGNTLLDVAAASANQENGAPVNWASATNFEITRCLNCPRTIGPYIQRSSGFSPGLVPNPFGGLQTIVFYVDATSTYASGTSTVKIISAKPKFSNGATVSTETFVGGSLADGTIYQLAGGATTANKVIYNSGYGLLCAYDSRCLVRIDNSAALSVPTLQAYGSTFPYQGP